MDAPSRQVLDDIRRALESAVARVCPPSLSSRRDDIVQRALLRVTGMLSRSEEGRPPGTSYLWKVAYTATVDAIRELRRQREVSIEEAGLEHVPAGGASDPEQAHAARELGRAIVHCLSILNATRALVVTLHLWGYGLTESASILGLSRKKADNALYRGLDDLRACLLKKGVRP